MKLYKFKEIIVSNKAMSKETTVILVTKCECDHPQPLSIKERIRFQNSYLISSGHLQWNPALVLADEKFSVTTSSCETAIFLEFWMLTFNIEQCSHFPLLFKQFCYVFMETDFPHIMKTFVLSFVHRIIKTQWMSKIKYSERNIFLIIWNSDLLFPPGCCWGSGPFGLLRRVVW
jgi:hypothetical protein